MIKQQISLRRGLAAIGAVIASVAMLMTVSVGAPTAAADGSSIELKSVSGATLDGHKFKAYRIGDYSNPIIGSDGKVSSVSVRNRADATDPASDINRWLASALSDNGVSILTGDDEAATISRITDAKVIAKVAKSLADSTAKPAESGSLDGSGASGTISLDSDGLYLITDTKGNPMIVGTKVEGKDMTSQQLGVAIIKSTDTADTHMVSAQLLYTNREPIPANTAVTAGQYVIVRLYASIPTAQDAQDLNFNADLSNFNFNSPNEAKLYTVADNGNLTDTGTTVNAVPSETPQGYIFNAKNLIAAYSGKRVALEYKLQVKGIDQNTKAVDKMNMKVTSNNGTSTVFENETTTVSAFTGTFDVKKFDIDDVTKLQGAEFKVARNDGGSVKWMNRDGNGMWSDVDSESAAGAFVTAADDGTSTSRLGTTSITGLGDGTYHIKETKAPDGHLLFGGVSANITITGGKLSEVRGDKSPKLSSMLNGEDGYNALKVKNISSITQLPQTGMNHWDLFAIIGTVIVVLIVGAIIIVRTRGERKREESHAASRSRRR